MPKTLKPQNKIEITPGSGNIYEDLALPDPELALSKAFIVLKLERLIQPQGLSLDEAAHLSGLSLRQMEDLQAGRVDRLTLETLQESLEKMEQHLTLTVTR